MNWPRRQAGRREVVRFRRDGDFTLKRIELGATSLHYTRARTDFWRSMLHDVAANNSSFAARAALQHTLTSCRHTSFNSARVPATRHGAYPFRQTPLRYITVHSSPAPTFSTLNVEAHFTLIFFIRSTRNRRLRCACESPLTAQGESYVMSDIPSF